MMKDPVISVRDLLAECVRKALVIILCAVVCAAALCGFKYYKDSKAIDSAAEAESSQESIEEVELTAEQRQQVQNYVNAVNQRDGLKDYLRDSIYINCNPYHIDYVQIQYHVQSESELEQREAILALRTYVLGGGLATQLSEKDGETDPKYFIELLRCESITHESNMNNGVVEIIMYAESAERAQTYAAWINECLGVYMAGLKDVGINCEFEKISEQTLAYMFTSIIYERNDKQSQLEDFVNKADELRAELTTEQLKLANTLLSEEVEEETGDEAPIVQKPSINVKYIVLGGVLGCVLGIVIIAVCYIFTNTIKVSTDVQNMFGVSCLGYLTCKKQTIMDKIANKLFYPRDCFDLAVQKTTVISKILFCCNRYDIHDVYMVTNGAGKLSAIDEVADELSKNGIVCKTMENLLSQTDAVKVKNVILVNRIQKTKYQEIENEILFYKNQNINVLGYVAVK